jgi:hypothetical protein
MHQLRLVIDGQYAGRRELQRRVRRHSGTRTARPDYTQLDCVTAGSLAR